MGKKERDLITKFNLGKVDLLPIFSLNLPYKFETLGGQILKTIGFFFIIHLCSVLLMLYYFILGNYN